MGIVDPVAAPARVAVVRGQPATQHDAATQHVCTDSLKSPVVCTRPAARPCHVSGTCMNYANDIGSKAKANTIVLTLLMQNAPNYIRLSRRSPEAAHGYLCTPSRSCSCLSMLQIRCRKRALS